MPGSPPLARGTAIASYDKSIKLGITPACAGNSKRPQKCKSRQWDHPRLRGEQAAWQMQPGDLVGSPPLARGTEGCGWIPASVCGITPACAGNSPPILIFSPPSRDHPRLRGEQRSALRRSALHRGSPPLARGTDAKTRLHTVDIRITPACAGNRHPRLRAQHGR